MEGPPERKFVVDLEGRAEVKEMTPEDRAREDEWVKKQIKEIEDRAREAVSKGIAEFRADQEKRNRALMAEFFRDHTKGNQEYSETLVIENDGSLNRKERVDGVLPFIVTIGELRTPEDLYQYIYKIQQDYPNFDFSFKTDKNRKWIKYTVKEKQQ